MHETKAAVGHECLVALVLALRQAIAMGLCSRGDTSSDSMRSTLFDHLHSSENVDKGCH